MVKLLNKENLADLLGISVAAINKMIARRAIPFTKVTATRGGSVRFDPAVIERWLQEQTTAAVART
jgi:excisionase family DNA binding protein